MSLALQSVGYNTFSLGGLLGGIGQGIIGIATGNPGQIGQGVAGIVGAFSGGGPKPTVPATGAPPTGGIYDTPIVGGVAAGIKKLVSGNGSCSTCPKGYHLNRHWLAPTKGGCGRTARSQWAAPGTLCVGNRRIHPLNSRAAKRAARRLKSAHKLFSKIDRQIGGGRRRSSCGCKGRKR